MGVIALIPLLLTALYIHPVQDYIVERVLTAVNSADSDTKVSVTAFRLSPPLRIHTAGVTVTERGDTMLRVDRLDARVSLLPLLKGNIGVGDIQVDGIRFKMGGVDSALFFRANACRLMLSDAEINLRSSSIDIDRLALYRAAVTADMRPDSAAVTDTVAAEPLPWKINLKQFDIDSLMYEMSMAGSIDSLGATVGTGSITDVAVDLSQQDINIESVTISHLTASYFSPTTTTQTAPATDVSTPVDSLTVSMPWQISVSHVDISADSAVYGTTGAVPVAGLDPDFIAVTDVSIVIDSLYNRGTELRVPVKRISAHERCGLDLTLTGRIEMDSDSLSASNIRLSTLHSAVTLDAMMGMKSNGLPMPLRVVGTGYVSPVDVSTVIPTMTPLVAGVPKTSLLDLNIDIAGNGDTYRVADISLKLPRCFDIAANGTVSGAPDLNTMTGRLDISGHVANGRWIKPSLVAAKLDKTVSVPPLALRGNVKLNRGTVTGTLNAATTGGRLALDATWQSRRKGYELAVETTDFPVDAIMPELGVRRLTSSVTVKGQGYDPFSPSTAVNVDVEVHSVSYNAHTFTDVKLSSDINAGNASVALTSGNRDAAFDIRARGNVADNPYRWTLDADIHNLDLKAIGITDSVMNGSATISGDADITQGNPVEIKAGLNVKSLTWNMSGGSMSTTDLVLRFKCDSLTCATLTNHDLSVNLEIPTRLDSLMSRLPLITGAVDSIMVHRRVDVEPLQHAIPPFTFNLKAAQNNIIGSYLRSQDMGLRSLRIDADNDSVINLTARATGFNAGATRIDTINADIYQTANSLNYKFHVGNRPGTLDQWATVNAHGSASANRASLLLHQQDIAGTTGYRLGFIARWYPDEINVRVVPSHPIIGYKTWTVNDSNFVSINTVLKHFDADLSMSNSESSIHLYTDHDHRNDSLQEDLILKVNNINLAEWVALNPFAPPVAGSLSANMRFGWDNSSVNGDGTISLTDLNYNRQRVGSFDLGVGLNTNKSGTVRATATLLVDGIKTITAEGNLNDSTARNPFLLDFKMIHFPLNVLNPFMPADMARFSGSLNGTMDITGSLTEPIFNGYLDFDSTVLTVPMFNSSYHFSDRKIPMDSNIITFDNYTIMGANANPLSIDGTVNARHFSKILIDLTARARNMQVINSKKKRGAQVYGKAFIDLTANINGSMSRLDIDANLSVLENTNVTYIVEDATNNLTSQSNNDMVKFVNFADTTDVAVVDTLPPSSMLIGINAMLNMRQGSVIGVDLSTDGKNHVELLSQGSLDYSMNYMGDSRLTGRLNLNGGYVRYSPPLMSEKLFDFQPGSYISFSGDMMDPYINLKAVDVIRANVQQEGQNSRLINFDVALSVTNTLRNMNVAFDLSTNDDITVANELQSMSAEQRANQAMNLLLYNVYTGPGTKASSSLSGNPLFSFLESQVNSWAANNIKGVDLSFGIDQYDRTVNGMSSTTTSYSYKVSKSLFNDRFKISVGGNYASDTDPDQNLSQNIINDISFEYMITPSGSMYVKIFRHTGYESILEGEITQTGVGFVYKRKLRRLSDLFKPLYRRRTAAADAVTTTLPSPSTDK